MSDHENNTLTCVYCGHAYPPGTPTHGAQVLTDHIKKCKKHPMSKVLKAQDRLRKAFLKLAGRSVLCPET